MTNLSPWLRRAFAISTTLCLLALCLLIWQSSQPQISTPANDGGFTLQSPAFLKNVYAQNSSFLTEEAGITAYTNIGKTIDLEHVEGLGILDRRRDMTNEYLLGSIILPSSKGIATLKEEFDIQIFIHRDGWILAYLMEWQNASLAIDWISYQKNKTNISALENSIRHIVSKINFSVDEIFYYDFSHPDATRFMLIADQELLHKSSDSFDIRIPLGFTLYESSWSHVTYDTYISTCELKDVGELSRFSRCDQCWRLNHGQIDPLNLQTGNVSTMFIYNNRQFSGRQNFSACGLALIYKENR